MPQAIARSNPGPCLCRYAGARFTVTRPFGKANPEFEIALRTRSRDSLTERSPSPTIANAGRPLFLASTSTVTRRGSTPSMANVVTWASTTLQARRARVPDQHHFVTKVRTATPEIVLREVV